MKTTILKKNINKDVEFLFDLHKKDRTKSRILLKNDPTKYKYDEIVLFEEKNNFTIIAKTVNIRMSSNNRMYFLITKKDCFIYKNNNFWFSSKIGKKESLKPLYCQQLQFSEPLIKDYFISKFSWIKFLNEKSVFSTTPFNTIVKHKLYNSNDLLKHVYKTNLPTARIMSENNVHYKEFKRYNQHCINLNENFNLDFLSFEYRNLFEDSLKMADTLNVKINCKWSVKRLKQEHDNWAKTITDIVLTEDERLLNIDKIYLDFAEKNTDLVLLKTTKDLALEGKKQSHCVATYNNNVDTGKSAIFNYNGYTAEICKNKEDLLILNQLRGFQNCFAPDTLRDDLYQRLLNFNNQIQNICY